MVRSKLLKIAPTMIKDTVPMRPQTIAFLRFIFLPVFSLNSNQRRPEVNCA